MAGVVEWNNGYVMQSAWGVTGQNNAIDQWRVLRQNRFPFYISEMVGLGEFIIEMGPGASWGTTDEMHNFDPDWLVREMERMCGGNWAGSRFVINVRAGSEFVGRRKGSLWTATGDCMWFGGTMNQVESITINNSGTIVGRGMDAIGIDNGGWDPGVIEAPPRAGHGIVVTDGVGPKMIINNYGNIGGGGGAGMGDGIVEYWDGKAHCGKGGQGGAPFGLSNRGRGGRQPPNPGWGTGGLPWYSYEDGNSRIRYGASGGWGEWGYNGHENSANVRQVGAPGRAIWVADGQPWPNIPGYPNAGWMPGGIGS